MPDSPAQDHEHRAFQPTVSVQVFAERGTGEDDPEQSLGYMAMLHMTCTDCGTAFWFPGAPAGQSFNKPHTTPDQLTLLVPMRPEGTKDMALDALPALLPPEQKKARRDAIRRALAAPQAFTVTIPNEDRTSWRVRAIEAALDAL